MISELTINIDGKDVKLNREQEASLRNQMLIMNAQSVLEAFNCANRDKLTNDLLLDIGIALEDAIYDNVGDTEFSVICEYLDELDIDESFLN